MKIVTNVTHLLGIDVPVAQAGMSWASSCTALPLAVARAGGLGVIGAGPMRVDDLARTVDEVRAGTDRPFAVNVPLHRQDADEVLDLLARRKVPILIASQGGAKHYLERFKAAGTRCIHVVASEEHARKAVDAGVDGLLVVGAEAGGHPPPDLVSTLIMVRAVVRVVGDTVPVIASGGFADGAGLAAALSLGAGAASFGTRFIATPEANVHRAYKEAVLAASASGTRAVGRELGVIRVLANAFADRMHRLEMAGAPLDERRAAFLAHSLKMAALDGDVIEGKVEAGQSAGLINDLVPAGDLVHRIVQEYLEALDRLPRATPFSPSRDITA
jgi:enoyl-[acyl-carrier protein] reductase II